MKNMWLRRLPVRQRVLAMVVVLAIVMLIPIPLGIIGQRQLLEEQRETTQTLIEIERALLLASARIADSQADLLRYLRGEMPTPESALADVNQALLHLDVARVQVGAMSGIQGAPLDGMSSAAQQAEAQVAEVQELRVDLANYQALIAQMQAATLTNALEEVSRLESQALASGAALSARIESAVDLSQGAWAAANAALLSAAQRRLVGVVLIEIAVISVALVGAAFALRSVTGPIAVLRDGAERVGRGDLDTVLPETGNDELTLLARVFNEMVARLARSYRELEQRVAARTAELRRRSDTMRAVIDVSRATTDILDPDTLVQQSVEVIRQRFGLYYVGLFLVDAGREVIHLRAGTGAAGEAMLARGHQLAVGQGMVGWCVANAQPRVSLEAAEDMMRVANPDLPGTRSEAAIPLRVRGQVIGALTVQDDQPDAFDEEAVELLQVMADLLAVNIENTRLLSEVQSSLEASQRAYGRMTQEGWLRLLGDRTKGYTFSRQGRLAAVEGPWSEDLREAWRTHDAVVRDHTLAVPIIVRGIRLGAMRLSKRGAAWTPRETALVQTIVDQLGIALEGARLYEDTQIAAARERLAREITDRMRSTVDWDDLMQTAVQEIGQAVKASRVFVQWLPASETGDDGDGETRLRQLDDGVVT